MIFTEKELRETLSPSPKASPKDIRISEYIQDTVIKIHGEDASPYMIGVHLFIAMAKIMHKLENDRHDEFMDFLIQTAQEMKDFKDPFPE